MTALPGLQYSNEKYMAQSADPVDVLIVSSVASDAADLSRAADSSFRVAVASSAREAASRTRSAPPPVVFVERQCSSELMGLLGRRSSFVVIFDEPDPRAWAGVLEAGAFDVIVRPLRIEQLRSALRSAHARCMRIRAIEAEKTAAKRRSAS